MEKIQIHYFLPEGEHSFDAKTFHRCEGNFLNVLDEISSSLGITIKAEVIAIDEGGVRQWFLVFGFVSATSFGVQVGSGLGQVFTDVAATVTSHYMTSDPELENAQKENLQADTLYKKVQTKKAEAELAILEQQKEMSLQEIKLAHQTLSKMENFQPTLKADFQRSQFYKNLSLAPKISAVSVSPSNVDEAAYKVPSSNFSNFVRDKIELPQKVDDKATIEIISPVLNGGRMKWRGLYNSEMIEFSMGDPDFKNAVKKLRFSYGNTMSVKLEVDQKLDDEGNTVINPKTFKVTDVYGVETEDGFYETSKGLEKRRRFASPHIPNMDGLDLFSFSPIVANNDAIATNDIFNNVDSDPNTLHQKE